MTKRSPAILPAGRCNKCVKGLRICPYNVANIGFTLETAFYLEGDNSRIGKVTQSVIKVVILKGKNGLILEQHLARSVLHIVQAAARLGAFTAVGAPAGQILGQVALPAVADAQRAVNKELYFRRNSSTNGTHLLQRHLPLKHYPLIAEALHKLCLFRRTYGTLGGSVHCHSKTGSQRQNSRILDD